MKYHVEQERRGNSKRTYMYMHWNNMCADSDEFTCTLWLFSHALLHTCRGEPGYKATYGEGLLLCTTPPTCTSTALFSAHRQFQVQMVAPNSNSTSNIIMPHCSLCVATHIVACMSEIPMCLNEVVEQTTYTDWSSGHSQTLHHTMGLSSNPEMHDQDGHHATRTTLQSRAPTSN